ncbi:hypothetical protein MMC06_003526 [Schaereria dolodes]|nr:hypothetical protein [Schaereria dolodes]
MPYERFDGKPLQEAIVGLGRTGLVIHHHSNALKIPRVYRNPHASLEEKKIEEIFIEQSCMFLDNEKEAFLRLEKNDGIVDLISLSEKGIEMAYMKNGSLSQYLELREPPHHLVTQWILKLARTISYAHSKCIIVADIASRNVLLDEYMSIKLCDFSDSAVMPLGNDMSQVVHYGLSVKTDIFQFGSLVYEILTRKPFKYDLLANEEVNTQRLNSEDQNWQAFAIWPQRELLPSTKHLQLGKIILSCWTGGYQHMEEVCKAIAKAIFA